MITTKSLNKYVLINNSKLWLLKDVNLEIAAGASVAILGPSGAGKSTLLALLAGLDQASSGEIELNGAIISSMNEEQRAAIRAKYVGFVFQSFQLIQSLTALENVTLPLELKDDKQALEKAKAFLEKVGLGERLQHYPNMLSGGEQQRVAIARAFACEPSILFADEPTGNLDSKTGEHIADLLFDLNQQTGTTLVLVTHHQGLAGRCQQQVRLLAGQIDKTV